MIKPKQNARACSVVFMGNQMHRRFQISHRLLLPEATTAGADDTVLV